MAVPFPWHARARVASGEQFIEFAVNIPDHDPQVGQAFFPRWSASSASDTPTGRRRDIYLSGQLAAVSPGDDPRDPPRLGGCPPPRPPYPLPSTGAETNNRPDGEPQSRDQHAALMLVAVWNLTQSTRPRIAR